MYIADMLSGAYLHEQIPSHRVECELHQENRVYKEISETDPAKYVRLGENRLTNFRKVLKDDTPKELTKVIHKIWMDRTQAGHTTLY